MAALSAAPDAMIARPPVHPAPHPVDLSVVIPAHDEEASIVELLCEIKTALDKHMRYEIVVVDDCSSDNTAALLMEARQAFPELRVFQHRKCYGQSAGLATGIHAARGTWIATLDADGQNDPADILKLWHLRERTGLVAGHRVKREDSRMKRLSSRIANGIRRRILGDNTPDTGCGLKLFRRDAFMALPTFDHFHRFLPALFIHHGHSVVSVPVNHRRRLGGRSHYGIRNRLWVGIIDLVGVMWLCRRSIGRRHADELS